MLLIQQKIQAQLNVNIMSSLVYLEYNGPSKILINFKRIQYYCSVNAGTFQLDTSFYGGFTRL